MFPAADLLAREIARGGRKLIRAGLLLPGATGLVADQPPGSVHPRRRPRDPGEVLPRDRNPESAHVTTPDGNAYDTGIRLFRDLGGDYRATATEPGQGVFSVVLLQVPDVGDVAVLTTHPDRPPFAGELEEQPDRRHQTLASV